MCRGAGTTFRELVDDGSIEIGDGYRAKLKELNGDGPLFLRAGALTDRGFDWKGLDAFQRTAPVQTKRGKAGDTVITTKGNSVGRVGQVPADAPDFVYSPHLSYWRPLDKDRIDPVFLYYWARSEAFDRQLRQLAFGTDMAPYFSLRDQLRLCIHLPSAGQQRAIAQVLGALDDKIVANGQLVETAARLIDARANALITATSMSAKLTEVATVVKGVSYRSAHLGLSTAALVTLKSIDRDGTFVDNGYKSFVGPYRSEQELRSGDVIIAQTDITQSGDVIGRAVRVPGRSTYDTRVASLDLAIVRPKDGMPSEYLLAALRRPEFREHCRSRASGTTVLHLGRGAIDSYEVPVVSPEAAVRYSVFARAIHELTDSVNAASGVLARTRDELLPLLMSGKLRVRDAQAVVSEVL
ncbi:type I restriction-modification system subunit S [Mycolicibacterium sp. TY66]|nr:type I restriction-modification system subunit S [Mycolicibacterium sp. TY66]BCJ80319.1 type I restriction-modification system subunit S [Mycolicibacterium sp. TY81]